MRNIFAGALALLGQDAICNTLARPLAEIYGGDGGPLGDNLVGAKGLEFLRKALGDLLVAGYVDCEEVFGCFF